MRHKTSDDTRTVDDASDLGSEGGFSRRGFLVGAGAAGAAVALAACSSSSSNSTKSSSTSSTTIAGASGANNDLKTAAFAASLEVLAVQTYKAALDAAQANTLGAVPPAGATFVQTAMSQHQAALDKWNAVLQGASQPAVTMPDAGLKSTVDGEFAKVKDFGGAAKLALQLEGIAAATYLKAISSLKGKDAIALAGSINVIDMQHQAILNYVLGTYPVPDTFAKTDMAASPS